ncbi:hypothetical protein QQ045_001903 [Rhodiola kirilowii]
MKSKYTSYLDCLPFVMAGCGMWKLWKARNKLVYEGKVVCWKRKCVNWAPQQARLIPKPYVDNMRNGLILNALGIHIPLVRTSRASLECWNPGESGNSMSIGFSRKDGRWVGGAVVRTRGVRFCMAFKAYGDQQNDFHALIWFIDKALEECQWSDVRSIQGSHPLFLHLQQGDDLSTPMDMIEDRRRTTKKYKIGDDLKSSSNVKKSSLIYLSDNFQSCRMSLQYVPSQKVLVTT